MASQRVGRDLVNKHQQKEAEGDGITNFKTTEAKNAAIHYSKLECNIKCKDTSH